MVDKKIFAILAAATVLAGCNDSERSLIDNGARLVDVPVTIMPVMTRATATNFESGDQIGLTITREAGVYADNALLSYNGSVFSGSTMWYEEGAETSTLKAYYPYQSAGVPTSFSVKADQSAGVSSSDFIAGSASDVQPTANAVTIAFKHKLARIVFNVKNNAGYDLTTMKLAGSIPTAKLDADFDATADPSASASEITACKTSDATWEAVVVPQTAAFTVSINASGKEMTQRILSSEIKAGYSYTINMIVNPGDLVVTLSGDIVNWNDGGNLGEDTSVQFDEYEDHFVYDGVSYNIKKMGDGRTWMVSNLRYVPKGMKISADPADTTYGIWYPVVAGASAASSDEATISSHGLLYNSYAAFGTKVNSENFASFEGAQGVCPKGWHIPTRAEFLALVGYSIKAPDESADLVNTEAPYYNSDYKGAKVASLDADGWNHVGTGIVNITSPTGTGRYVAVATSATTANAPYVGIIGMTYYLGSTGAQVTTSGNIQLFGMMTSFTKAYMDGRYSVAYANYKSGYAIRCIKDAE